MKRAILAVFIVMIITSCACAYDLNGDSWDDIVFSHYQDNNGNFEINSYIYWGSDTGYTESLKTELPTLGSRSTVVADLNGDSFSDILFANYSDNNSSDVNSYIYWGSASGYSVGNRAELYSQASWDTSVADLNGDTYADIVFSSGSSTHDSTIYWGSSSGYSEINTQTLAVNRARDIEIADLNGDSKLDIFFCHRSSDLGDPVTESYIYWGSDAGFSDSNRQTINTTGALGSCVADINMDGKMDIIVAQYNNGTTSEIDSLIFWGDDAGTFSTTTAIPTAAATDVTVSDLNGDGYIDIIFTNQHDDTGDYSINSFIAWGDETYTFTDKTYLPTIGASAVAVTDYNNDAYPDIVIANAYDDSNPLGARELNSYMFVGDETYSYTGYIELPTIGSTALSAGPVIQQEQVIPEPVTVILLNLSLIGLIFNKRKRA